MKLSELAIKLSGIDAKLTEASTEISAKIAELKTARADIDVPDIDEFSRLECLSNCPYLVRIRR